jgi:arylsulfatase A-like enzyme
VIERPTVFALALAAGTVACSRGGGHASPTPTAAASGSARVTASAPLTATAALDPLASPDECVFGHRGVLLDFGDEGGGRAKLTPIERSGRVDAVEREGSSWARVFARAVTVPFVATADDVASGTADGATPVLEARIRGGSAKSVMVFLNGKVAGAWPIAKGEVKVVSLKLTPDAPNAPQLVTGTNELLLRFRGAAKAGASAPDEEAEVDWVHIGGAAADETYAAPTRADAITSITLGGIPMRSLSLRAPAYARCTGWLPSAGHLVGSVGVVGVGDADLEIRALRDRAPPAVLASMHLSGNAAWKPVDLALPAHPAGAGAKGTLGAVELVAVRSTRGARVVFGEPRVLESGPPPTSPPPRPPVNGVVLVVLGDVAPRLMEPFMPGGTPMPELTALAKSGVSFDANRAASGAGSGSLASMLTALPPRAHGVTDDEAGLAAEVTTLADVARQAGIRAAMFTANPTTGSAFGFARGWDTFLEHLPDVTEAPGAANAPFDDAARWISDRVTAGVRFLVVVHARGGHPPWDATPEQLRTLPPQDYTGGIDPKHASELLVRARGVTGSGRPSSLRLNDADRTRAWALYALALKEHDGALGRLLAAIKVAGRDADTMVVVAGDVGMGESRAPLEDPDALSEATLSTPLVVRFAGADVDPSLAGRKVGVPTTSADVARTIVTAFGLTPPQAFGGVDLAQVATAGDAAAPRGRPLVAVDGNRFALRWGSFVLRGVQPETAEVDSPIDLTKLCDLSLEPECTSDVRGAFPLALSALRRELLLQVRSPHGPVPVVEASNVRGSLKLWGL